MTPKFDIIFIYLMKELEEMSKDHDLLEILATYFPRDYDGKDTKELLNG